MDLDLVECVLRGVGGRRAMVSSCWSEVLVCCCPDDALPFFGAALFIFLDQIWLKFAAFAVLSEG